jgi:CRISPR-associated endonuclease/helicase Cas3
VLSLLFLSYIEVPEKERPWLAAAIASHHKGLFELFAGSGPFYPSELFGCPHSKASHLSEGIERHDSETLISILEHANDVFRATGWPPIEPYLSVRSPSKSPIAALLGEAERILDFLRRFSRIRSLRPGTQAEPDWPGAIAAIHTRGLLINSDHLASFGRHEITQALNKVSHARDVLRKITSFNSFQLSAAGCGGSAILVGPTGSGKTEAALLWASAQAEMSNRNGRILFLLPYQASMNAMQERLVSTLFPEAEEDRLLWNNKVSIAHGRSIRKTYEALLGQNYGPEESASLAKAQEELARLHASPILVPALLL